MRNITGRRLADSVGSVGSMILFLLFTACSLIIICTGASTYARISKNFRNTFSSSAAVRYVTNKIRGGESVELANSADGLAVSYGSTVCIIASGAGGISEKTVLPDDGIDYDGGDIIFADSSLTVTPAGKGLYLITVSGSDGSYSAYCRSKEG